VRARLYEQDVAVLTDLVRDLDVECDLEGPARVARRVGGPAVLVDLAEAAVGARALRQAVRRAERSQVTLDVRVVVGVNDADRLRGRARQRQGVGTVELVGAERARRWGGAGERRPGLVGDDLRAAAGGLRRRRFADALEPVPTAVVQPRLAPPVRPSTAP